MLQELSVRYRKFAELECRGYSDLYFDLANGVAEADEILRFLVGVPDPQPNLLFAAVQYIAGPDGMPRTASALADFLATHRLPILGLMTSRHTQTNEVGRCAVLLPALPEGPLALIEVGASAGLCLLLDRFYYDYGVMQVGTPSPIGLRCAPLGPSPIPLTGELPNVVWRRGLDIDPVDVAQPEDARWLMACVWSDHPERRERLRHAIQIHKLHRPQVSRGDLVDDLPQLIGEAPMSATLVVFHSALLPYVKPDRWRLFEHVLRSTSVKRPIVWLSNEGPGLFREVEKHVPQRPGLRFRLVRTTVAGGRIERQLLGLAHGHGSDLEWLNEVAVRRQL